MPYRNSEKPLSKIKEGLIHTSFSMPHRCFLPRQTNWFERLFWGGEKLAHGAVFRCSCKKTYIYCKYQRDSIHNYNSILYPRWEECDIDIWIGAGGEE